MTIVNYKYAQNVGKRQYPILGIFIALAVKLTIIH